MSPLQKYNLSVMAKNEKKTEVKKVVPPAAAKAPTAPGGLAKVHDERIKENGVIMQALESAMKTISATKNPSRSIKFASTRIREAMQMLARDTKGHHGGLAKLKAKAAAAPQEVKEEVSAENAPTQ
jgi:hypothetical protein